MTIPSIAKVIAILALSHGTGGIMVLFSHYEPSSTVAGAEEYKTDKLRI